MRFPDQFRYGYLLRLAYDPIARDYGLIMPAMYFEELIKMEEGPGICSLLRELAARPFSTEQQDWEIPPRADSGQS